MRLERELQSARRGEYQLVCGPAIYMFIPAESHTPEDQKFALPWLLGLS